MQSTLNVEFSETDPLSPIIWFNRKGLGCIRVPIQESLRGSLTKRFGRASARTQVRFGPDEEA
jgi:hypothetical protein